MTRSPRRLGQLLLVAALAFIGFYLLFRSDYFASEHRLQLANWEPLPDGPRSPEDGCRLRSERARYAVDRAVDPECRRRLLRVACAFESGRLPYRQRSPPGQPSAGCPARLPGTPTGAGCYRLALAADTDNACQLYPYELAKAASSADCAAHCREAGYRLAGSGESGCVCLQLLNAGCGWPLAVGFANCTMLPHGGHNNAYWIAGTGLNASSIVLSHVAPAYGPEFESYSWENDRVRIVYLMTLSGRGVRQVMRLFSALYYVNHYYYIHVDSRDDYMYESLLPLENRFANVRLMQSRFPTIWGGTGLLDLMLAAFRDLLLNTDWHWDYVINLSESDYPIRPNPQLTAYLTEMRHLSFLASHSGNYSDFMRKQAIERYFVQCDNHMYFLGDREPIEGLLFDGGSDWLTLNREFVQFVMAELESNGTAVANIVDYFRYGLLPVESVFHTIAQNTELCGRVANSNLRLINWDRKRGCRCQHLPVADWCGCSPMVYRGSAAADAVSALSSSASVAPASSNVFFARKFDPTISVAAIDAVSTSSSGRLGGHRLGRPRYWQSAFDNVSANSLQKAAAGYLSRLLSVELLSKTCSASLNGVGVVEVTEYYLEDAFQGPVLTVSVGGSGDSGQTNLSDRSPLMLDAQFSLREGVGSGLSVRIQQQQQQQLDGSNATSVISARYKQFEVGRQYDWKEGFFRNRLSLLPGGQSASEAGLQLRYAWGPGPAVTATFLLMDPDGAIRSAFQLSVPQLEHSTAGSGVEEVGCTELQAPGGLEPGVWRLLLIDERQPPSPASAVAECEFALLPVNGRHGNQQLEPVKPDPSSPQYLALFNAVPPRLVSELKSISHAGDQSAASSQVAETALALQLLGRRYRLEAVCRHSDAASACPGIVGLTDLCSGSEWSTRYPDPRYSLGGLDPLTGYLRQP